MVIGFPHCTFKCEKDCKQTGLCQNSALAKSPSINVDIEYLVNRYMNNKLSNAIVMGGLEPIDSPLDLLALIKALREKTTDDIVIYTGYNKNEIPCLLLDALKTYENIVVKFGRFIPNQEKHYDEVLGVYLVSNNQYAERIS